MRRGEEEELRAAKQGYKAAKLEGCREEEARWANVVGDLYKRRGEYVKALQWLRIDYDISSKYLHSRQLLPTCQSIGELHLLLDQFNDALIYQKKHLDLAKNSDDLIEQQRACTQLGRTYHEILRRSENDHSAIRNAKKYFGLAMKLARTLKGNVPCKSSAFSLKEYIDAHNNVGMLELDLDSLEEAERILSRGLKICDEEEVAENDDARSRLHNNLGSVYLEMRDWSKSRAHMEKDILICRTIGHIQGEAKGYINLGELHYRTQKYEDAIRCYQKAFEVARCLEDEDSLIDQIEQNKKIVEEAAQVMDDLKKDEQKLKKLVRATCDARGKSRERKCLLEQNACLDGLIEQSRVIFAWHKHKEFSKRKKRVVKELCDTEKLADSFLAIGESYQKLRNFNKSRKWYMKSWNASKSIGSLEGQALAKINIGEVLDSLGDWAGALQAFEEGYRLATDGNLLSVQLIAINNMHYSHMLRFDNVEEARKLQHDIQSLRQHLQKKEVLANHLHDYCSETETKGVDCSCNSFDSCASPNTNMHVTSRVKVLPNSDEVDDDVLLINLFDMTKKISPKRKTLDTTKDLSKSNDSHSYGHKRLRVVISDDEIEFEGDDKLATSQMVHSSNIENVGTSNRAHISSTSTNKVDETTAGHVQLPKDRNDQITSKVIFCSGTSNLHVEESFSSFRSNGPAIDDNVMECGSSRGFSKQSVNFKIGDDFMQLNLSCADQESLDIANVKAEVACMYYLRQAEHKRSKGLLPVIGCLKHNGNDLCSVETIRNCNNYASEHDWIEVVIEGWIPKRLMKLYVDNCEKLHEIPNMKLLKKLYNLEISEDEIMLSDCGLQDLSILPFLNALEGNKTVAIFDVSHNLLGNETMEKLKQILTSANQKYGGLTLDLHSNRFGPSALFQICESPIILARLEVLNLSENRLTDACSSYISTILENCRALYSLKIEQCSITSRTIEKLADSLHDGAALSHLFIGKNGPVSIKAMTSLLSKLQTLKRFSELSLAGIKLNKPMVDALCEFARAGSISTLLLGGTQIGSDGAVRLTEDLSNREETMRLDLSCCGLSSPGSARLCANVASVSGLVELDLSGNSLGEAGLDALATLFSEPMRLCNLKSLALNKCRLRLAGIIRLLQALAGDDSLEELHLAENSDSTDASSELCVTNSVPKEVVEEVEDSEDDAPEKTRLMVEWLSAAIVSVGQLQLLDLSHNGFGDDEVEALFSAWVSPATRCSVARKHAGGGGVLHLFVEGRTCCGLKACCRKE